MNNLSGNLANPMNFKKLYKIQSGRNNERFCFIGMLKKEKLLTGCKSWRDLLIYSHKDFD
jgi:hypothetical protein